MSPPGKATAPPARGAGADTKASQPPRTLHLIGVEPEQLVLPLGPNATPWTGRSTPHVTEMAILGDRIAWLDRFEHWWTRQLRWHRERSGPDCTCVPCTRWSA
jgi:hypothetical protein